MSATCFAPREGAIDTVVATWERLNSQGKSNTEIWILRLGDATEDRILKLEILSPWDKRSGRRFTSYLRHATDEGEK